MKNNKTESLEILKKITNNFYSNKGKDILFKIAKNNGKIKITDIFLTEQTINGKNCNVEMFSFISNLTSDIILNCNLNIFTKNKYMDKECTKLISTFKNDNELLSLLTVKDIFENDFELKPILIKCFIKMVRTENGHLYIEIIETTEIIFEIS